MKKTALELANILRNLAEDIEDGDSFEGSFSYTCMLEGLAPQEFEVEAAFRVGNSEGQGGMVILRAENLQTGMQNIPTLTPIRGEQSGIDDIRSENIPSATPVTWSHEKPTKPGSYWMQESSGVTGIVEVRESFDGQKGAGRFEWLNGYGWHPVDEKEAAWAGPIPEPEGLPNPSSGEGSDPLPPPHPLDNLETPK